ncbi:hypothetical protein, partial [Bacteroides faecis]|uniref:hypothetical protein n=1 Tax=Bacteroides faecis TaxID=674529 RepID=UPI0019605F4F
WYDSKNLRDTVCEQYLAKMGFLRDDYVASLNPRTIEPKQGNVLKAFFADKYVNYDSSWR